MNPGRLDRKVTIQARTASRDDEGSPVVSYATEATVPCERVQMTGSEARRSAAVRADVNLTLRIRFRSTLTEQHRLVFEGRTYDIVAINEEGRRATQLVQANFTEGATS